METYLKQPPKISQTFQTLRSSKLRRAGVPLTGDLSTVTPFSRHELEKFKTQVESLEELKGVDFHRLSLDYTTQLPITRGQLIDVASSLIYLIAPLPGKNWANGGLGIDAIRKLISDYGALAREKVRSDFLDLAIAQAENALNGLAPAKNSDILQEEAEKMLQQFQKSVSDLELVVKAMFDKGLTEMSIYTKLSIDLEFMVENRGFIYNALKKNKSVRADLHKKYASLEQQLSNIRHALDHTDPHTSLGNVVKIAKWLFASVFVGSATTLAAKGELISLLMAISQTPNLIYVSIVGGLIGLGFAAEMSLEIWKAFRENHYIKKYENKQEKLIRNAIEYTRKHLKLIGFKFTKEAAFTGYIEALQDEVSGKYLIAAYKGDFATINAIYDRQSDRMIGEHTIGYYFRIMGDWMSFRRFGERKIESTIRKEVLSADGYFDDILRGKGESAIDGVPSKSE